MDKHILVTWINKCQDDALIVSAIRSRTIRLSPAVFRAEASSAVILLSGGFSNVAFFSSEGRKLSALFSSCTSYLFCTEVSTFLSDIFTVNLLL